MLDYLVDVLGFTPEFRVTSPDGSVKFAGAWWGEIGKGTRLVLGEIEEALHGNYDHGEFGQQMVQHPLGTGVVLYFYSPNVDHSTTASKRKARRSMNHQRTSSGENARSVSSLPRVTYLTFATPIRGFRLPPEFAKRMEDLRPKAKRQVKRKKR